MGENVKICEVEEEGRGRGEGSGSFVIFFKNSRLWWNNG